MSLSPAKQLALAMARASPAARAKLERELAARAEALRWDWPFWARPEQLPPPGDGWTTWLVRAGRGFGKTRVGAEYVRACVRTEQVEHIALVAKTPADARTVMIEGPAGILRMSPVHERPVWQPSRRLLTWPNGARATIYSGENPDQLRGPQHQLVWADEVAAYQYPADTLDNIQLGLRLPWRDGSRARGIYTTTPKPLRALADLAAAADTVITSGSTYENVDNLDAPFIKKLRARYEGTRLGRQELHAEVLEDVLGALWSRALIELHRVRNGPQRESFERIVVAVDPAATSGEESAETGLIVVGITEDGHLFVLADGSGRMTPTEWGTRAVELWDRWKADAIVIEVNQGGDMAENTLRVVNPDVPVRRVTARVGKRTRAEPVSALYEQGRVHHVGHFAPLEDQLCAWTGAPTDESPDRLDALVWAVFALVFQGQQQTRDVVWA
jgi:phage terminase large subunit-like protein